MSCWSERLRAMAEPSESPAEDASGRTWLDDEPGWADVKRELRCIRSRLRVRWHVALLLTIFVVAVGTFRRARKQRTFQSTIVMRVTEDDFDSNTAPPTSNQLQSHLAEVALSRRTLFALIKENGLYADEYDLDPNLALEMMRDDIELEVVSNYFARERYREDPPRSARIALSYVGRDPEQALSVARQLGRTIEAQEQSSRRRYARSAAEGAEEIADGLRKRLMAAQQRSSQLKLDLPQLQGVERLMAGRVQRRLEAEIGDLSREIELYEQRRSNYSMRQEFEGQAMGLSFEVVDAGRPAKVLLTNQQRLTVFASLAFFFVLPISVIFVGTFDARVRDKDGLRRIGLKPFGQIPRYPGDDVGSVKHRKASS